jgi:hypothetical protein
MSKVERVARGNRAGKADMVLAAVEAGLTPFMQACLAKIHMDPDFVIKENARRKELRKDGSKVPNLKANAGSSPHWDYADILKTFSSLWPQFDSQITQMIALRNRGAGHRHLGQFTDKDLGHLCKYAEQLLRATGVVDEADFVERDFPQYLELARSDPSVLPSCLPENCHSVEEFLNVAGPVAGMPKPVSMQVTETKIPDCKTLRVGSKTLTLKPRTETGTVRQSFSHGRTKQLVVEKRGKRLVVEIAKIETAAAPAGMTAQEKQTDSEDKSR